MKALKSLQIIITILMLSWLLPWVWKLATDKPQNSPFVYYSSLINSFGIRSTINETTLLTDDLGNSYTQTQFDSILPMVYYRQLAREGQLPDSLHGQEINQRIIARNNFFYRYRPSDKNQPLIPLYALFESMPKRIDLEMPGDIMRLRKKPEFINPDTGTPNTHKSTRFANELEKEGFAGPPSLVAGNPTTRKSYDEGYFIVDQNKNLFHLKMVNARPYVAKIELPEDLLLSWITVTEYPTKAFYCFLISNDGRLFTVQTDGYKLKEIPTPSFDPETDNLLIMGNLFHWNIQVSTNQGQTTYAVDAHSFKLVNQYTFETPAPKDWLQSSIFPFSINFSSANDKFIFPRIKFNGWTHLPASVLLLLGYLALQYRKKSWCPVTSILLLVTGIYGLLAFLLVGDTKHI